MLDYFKKDYTNLLTKKLWLFDLDGTIYLENNLFSGVKELLEFITKNGGNYVFITNNSAKSVSEYVNKLSSMGISVTPDNFFTSAQASELVINKNHFGKLIYVQGTSSLIDYLTQKGVNVTTNYDENIGAILVGFDAELTAEKMRTTSKVLTKLNVPYYATNPDWVCPVDFGYIPDCGSMCFGYEKATGKTPIFIGKPSPIMINEVAKKYSVNKSQIVVIGDRLYTDIAAGENAGVDTVLVLSGEATIESMQNFSEKPTYVFNGVWEILGKKLI